VLTTKEFVLTAKEAGAIKDKAIKDRQDAYAAQFTIEGILNTIHKSAHSGDDRCYFVQWDRGIIEKLKELGYIVRIIDKRLSPMWGHIEVEW